MEPSKSPKDKSFLGKLYWICCCCCRQNATYMAVSEASDDMYAAIEDPTYIPAGAISQTNSDTYAVINLPDYDSGSQTYQKLEGAEEV